MKSVDQLSLFGHGETLLELINLEKINKLPNKLLFSGKKGIGKSILAHHFINYLFSKNEEGKYDINNFIINKNNKSFILVKNNTHPNLYKISHKYEKKNIEISYIRELISFTNLSSFADKKKIIFIDDVEHLNINSTNALLKSIEEPSKNTHYILIHNNEKKIKETLKSRCIEFKLSINKKIVKKIVNKIYGDDYYNTISSNFINLFETPNHFINFINICNSEKLDYKKISIEKFIHHIIKNNLFKKKEFQFVDFQFYIEIYFRRKIIHSPSKNIFNLYSYFNRRYNQCKTFNLDMESFFLEFNSELLNE